jgi:hypothetical protein
MGRYDKFAHKSKPRPERNPIWRGIGCILMVIVPLITYALTVILDPVLIKTGLVPPQMRTPIHFPNWVARTVILKDIASFLGGIKDLWLGILVFIVLLIVITGVVSIIYVSILQVIGPARYGETDAPPTKYKAKVYKR